MSDILSTTVSADQAERIADAAIELVVSEIFLDGADLALQVQLANPLGISKQRVHQLTTMEDFPKPIMQLSDKRAVWLVSEVLGWNEQRLDED